MSSSSFNLVIAIIFLCLPLHAKPPEGRTAPPQITRGDRWSNTLIEFSVSGIKGPDGTDGTSYDGQRAANGPGGSSGGDGSDGRNGRHGDDGTEAGRGTDGGNLDLLFDIPPQGAPGLITVNGHLRNADNLVEVTAHKIILDQKGVIRLVSRGGQGGMGGYGGYGEDGGHGGDGGNGIGNQAGGDGGRGGRGGDAGAGKNGAPAGNAGLVRIGIPTNQLEIAWAVTAHVPGGLGGTHGEHGLPGNGGHGGSGGIGGTYTVTVTKTRTVTDSDGESRTETYTEEETRHAPNGSSGAHGSDGDRATSLLSDGAEGNVGKIEWYIVDENGRETPVVDDRYRLNLVGFRFVDINSGHAPDGIFEPGETGVMDQIFVRNTGLLPTPQGAKTRFRVKSGAYFLTEGITFDIPEGLAPGEVRLINDASGNELKIPFHVRDISFTVPPQQPFVRTELIQPVGLADIAGIERLIPEFNDHPNGQREFTIQYPVHIEPIQTPPSLARGEAARFIFKITNISQQDFGSASEIRRQLRYFIRREGGDLDAGEVELFDEQGHPLNLDQGFLNEIANLKAGESKIIEFIVGVSGAADSYTSSVSKLDLEIDQLGKANGEGLQNVQRRVQLLTIADDYFKTPESDFLLVANHRLSRQTYLAWKELAEQRLGTTIDIWDLSYKNFINFMTKLTEDNALEQTQDGYSEHRTSLAEDFAGKTIILLADDFEDTSGQTQRRTGSVWDYVSLQDLREAAVKHKINLRIIGSRDESRTLFDLVSPQAVEENRIEYVSIGELREALIFTPALTDRKLNDNNYWEVGMWVPVTRWRWLTNSRPSYLLRQAQRLVDVARGENPDTDLMVVHHFSGTIKQRHGVLWGIAWFGKTWQDGDLEIIRSVKADTGNLVTSQNEPWISNSKDYVLGEENLLKTLLSRSFERNFTQFESYVARYPTLTADQKATVPTMAQALLKMLVMEQVSLRSRLEYMPRSLDELSTRLAYLNFLKQHRFAITTETPQAVREVVMGLLVDLQTYSLGQRKWWERYLLLNATRNAKISRITQTTVNDLVLAWFGDTYSKREILDMMKKAFNARQAELIKRFSPSNTWADVTVDFIELKSMIEDDPRFDSLISRYDFQIHMTQLQEREGAVIHSRADAQRERKKMGVDNPMIMKALDTAAQRQAQLAQPPAPLPPAAPASPASARCSEIVGDQ